MISNNTPKRKSNTQQQPIPTTMNRVVRWSDRYTEDQIKTNPNLLFLFGDNDKAKYRADKSNPGGGGQALVTRPTGNGKLPFDRLPKDGGLNGNAIGITTTFLDGYTPSIDEFKALMDKEFEPIGIWVKAGGTVVIPHDNNGRHNLGTGIADLKNKITGAIEYIQIKVDELVRLGQQPIQNLQGKSLDTLKQELHDTLSKERQFFQSLGGLENYLSNGQQRLPQKRPSTDSGEVDSKKPRTEVQENVSVASKKRTRVPRKYSASGLKSTLHGTVYQLKLLMLFLKRGIRKGYSFLLATEMDAAEKFDDLVFQYTKGNKTICRFLQAKHKQDADNIKIEVGDLLTKRKSGEFGLAKYFVSYLKIKNNQDFADSELEDFVLCTNIDFDLDQSTIQDTVKKLKVKTTGPNQGIEISVEEINTSDIFFKDGGTRYKFSYNNIISTIQPVFKSAVEEEVEGLEKEIKRLQSRSDRNIKKKLERNQRWQSELSQLTKDKKKLEDNMKEFFDKLVFAVNQPSEIQLMKIIKDGLGDEFNSIHKRYVYARFQKKVLSWMKEKEGRFLTHEDGEEFFNKMREEILKCCGEC